MIPCGIMALRAHLLHRKPEIVPDRSLGGITAGRMSDWLTKHRLLDGTLFAVGVRLIDIIGVEGKWVFAVHRAKRDSKSGHWVAFETGEVYDYHKRSWRWVWLDQSPLRRWWVVSGFRIRE